MGELQKALTGWSPDNSNLAQVLSQPVQQATTAQTQQPSADSTGSTDSQQPDNATPPLLMIAPSGEAAYVPQEQVANAQAKGAKIGIRMTAPDGKEKAVVPFDLQDGAQKQGATWDVSPDNDNAKAYLTKQKSGPLMDSGLVNPDLYGSEKQAEKQVGAGLASAYKTGAVMAATGAVGGALAAPTAVTAEVSTGLVDEFGAPIARQIVSQGPSLIGQGFKAAVTWAMAHPTTAKLIIEGAGVAGALKILHGMAKLDKEFK